METYEKIKRGLECDCCGECPWLSEDGCMWSDDFAIALIQQLEQDNAQKDERIRELEREREALLEESKHGGGCFTCKHQKTPMNEPPCDDCMRCNRWEWHGVEEGQLNDRDG